MYCSPACTGQGGPFRNPHKIPPQSPGGRFPGQRADRGPPHELLIPSAGAPSDQGHEKVTYSVVPDPARCVHVGRAPPCCPSCRSGSCKSGPGWANADLFHGRDGPDVADRPAGDLGGSATPGHSRQRVLLYAAALRRCRCSGGGRGVLFVTRAPVLPVELQHWLKEPRTYRTDPGVRTFTRLCRSVRCSPRSSTQRR